MITAVKIEQSAQIETILHVCCRDRNIIGLQSDMLGAFAIGLRNVLLITGDPPKLGEYPDATAVFDLDSIALTRLVANLNMGIDIGSNTILAAACADDRRGGESGCRRSAARDRAIQTEG